MEQSERERIASLETALVDIGNRIAGRDKANLADALVAGEMLIDLQRRRKGDKNWMHWLKTKWPLGRQSARDYMDLAEHDGLISSAGNPPRSIRAALKLIKAEKSKGKAIATEPAADPILWDSDVVVMPRPKGDPHVLAVGDNSFSFLTVHLFHHARMDLRVRSEKEIVVVSDPPFGQGKVGVPGDHTGDQRAAWGMFRPRGGFIYASPEPHLLRQSWDGIEAAGGTVVHMLIEDKGAGLFWADRLQNRFDVILFFERTDSVWIDGRRACSILKPDLSHEARDERKEMAGDHTTPKHVSTISELIRLVTNEGDTVLDPFAGSGTTLIAAHRTKRRFVGCEIDPGYAETAVNNYVRETGLVPTVHMPDEEVSFAWGTPRPE